MCSRHSRKMKNNKEKPEKWKVVLKVLAILLLLSFIMASCVSFFIDGDYENLDGNTALIEIKGPIMGDDSSFGLFSDDVASSSEITRLIRKADRDSSIKAIVVEINSPGGSAVASDEIAQAVKAANKTTVAWIREIGTSGGYWIASSADTVVANRMSITGSIVVIASYLNFGGFISDHNITYERLVAGQYKDIGSPFRDMTPSERILFQKSLDRMRGYFIDEVAANRGLKKEEVEKIATGLFYLGDEAKDLGLVDELGGRDEVIAIVKEKIGEEVEFRKFSPSRGFFGLLEGVFSRQSFYIGEGIGSGIVKKAQAQSYPSILA